MIPDESGLLKKFDIPIGPCINYLLNLDQHNPKNGIILTSDQLGVTDCYPGCLYPKEKDGQKCGRFTLKIPYAQQTLKWQVVLNMSDLKEPPDFIFDSEDYDFHPSLAEINGLLCWDWQNQESLFVVLTELLEHYGKYQLERASSNPVLHRHMQSLLAHRPQDMQLIVNRAKTGLGTLNCLLRINVDFAKIPPYLIQGNPGEACAALHVCIPYPESKSIQAQLYLSPSVEFAFGGSSNLKIPAFHSGMLIGEYFANVKALLENQVKLISDGFEKRRDYIAAFVSHFGGSVLEYDIQSFQKITLLWEWNDFFFTFTVELPLYFPSTHPTYILKSVYHNQNGRPYTEKFTDFPYSPRWDGNEMAKRASAFVVQVIPNFQKSSVNQSGR